MNHALRRKTVVIGLDCAEPSLVFGRFRDKLPHIRALTESCWYGPLRSCDPPITVPAWSVMTSGRTPGELGIYGFRNRASRDYDHTFIARGDAVTMPRLWDYVGQAGGTSIVIGVPQSWPSSPIRGYLVGGLFADPATGFTQPATLGKRIRQNWPDYQTDVVDFRQKNKHKLLEQIHRMTRIRFETAAYLMRRYPWDFFMMVEIGLDRIQHAFWQYMDTDSPYYQADSDWEDVILDYYILLDNLIGEWLRDIPPESDLWLVSDHGAQTMRGLLRLNQWLIDKGYLTLKYEPETSAMLRPEWVDWSRTRVWADGGYYGRLWFNVKNREPRGIVAREDIPALKKELIAAMSVIQTENGIIRANRLSDPEKIYPAQRGIAPDLMLYADNLALRVSAAVGGTGALFTLENDTGPDGANHAAEGLYLFRSGDRSSRGTHPASIYDVAPAILKRMGLSAYKELPGDFPHV